MNHAFDVRRFLGDWYVVASTFPMWGPGRRTDPCFHYAELPARRGFAMSDVVTFRRRGREGRIVGEDTQLADSKASFRWRGRGLLRLFSSRWQVIEVDSEYQWVVITFSRSLVTPAGVDVIARTSELPEQAMREILDRVGDTATGLFHVEHGGQRADYPLSPPDASRN